MVIRALHAWGQVDLLFLVAEDGDPINPAASKASLAVRFPDNELWELEAIIKNWRDKLNRRLMSEHEAGSRGADGGTLLKWAAEAREMIPGVELIYGAGPADAIRHAADAIEQTVRWPESYIIAPPRDPGHRAKLYLSIELWAFDRFREVCLSVSGSRRDELPGRNAGRSIMLAPAIRVLLDEGIDVPTSDDAWQRRVARLVAKLKPGQEDALVADVVSACGRSGRFTADGREKPS